MAVSTIGGNIAAMGVVAMNIDPVSVPASTTLSQVFPFPGGRLGDVGHVTSPSTLPVGLGVVNVAIGVDTVILRFMNASIAALDPPAGIYFVAVMRAESGTFTGFSP